MDNFILEVNLEKNLQKRPKTLDRRSFVDFDKFKSFNISSSMRISTSKFWAEFREFQFKPNKEKNKSD